MQVRAYMSTVQPHTLSPVRAAETRTRARGVQDRDGISAHDGRTVGNLAATHAFFRARTQNRW